MADSDEDHGRSRKPSAEDRGWSHRSGTWGRMIERSGDAMRGLHCAHGDEERRFLR
jgi:hypothetical protein